jgi:hypothetical protein
MDLFAYSHVLFHLNFELMRKDEYEISNIGEITVCCSPTSYFKGLKEVVDGKNS